MHTYDARSVVYVEVPLRRGEMPYVGETSESAWVRHDKRLHHVFAREAASAGGGRAKYARAEDELDEYERQLRRCGAEAARHERYVMVLEQVQRAEGEGGVEWAARRKRVEKFWVSTLHSAFNKRGWNVENAPATLQRTLGGRPTRRAVNGQERARRDQRGRNRKLKRRQRSSAQSDAGGDAGGDAAAGGRRERRFHRGPRKGRAEGGRTRRRGRGSEEEMQRRQQTAVGGGRRRVEG